MSKRIRQQAIVDLVSKQRVQSQAALSEELNKLGFDVTQATLSRDIAELNLVKSKEGYLRPEDARGATAALIPDPEGTLRRLVLKVEAAQNMVVIRTPPGSARLVAIILEDPTTYKKVVGSLGGDDTCLLILHTNEEAQEFRDLLLDFIG